MRSHIADQTMRMCQRLNDLTPQNGAVICFGHVMKLCVIFDNNSCSKIQFHKNRNDDKITTICKVTDFQCFAFMFDIYFCSYLGFLSVFPNMFVNKSKQIYLKKNIFFKPWASNHSLKEWLGWNPSSPPKGCLVFGFLSLPFSVSVYRIPRAPIKTGQATRNQGLFIVGLIEGHWWE